MNKLSHFDVIALNIEKLITGTGNLVQINTLIELNMVFTKELNTYTKLVSMI